MIGFLANESPWPVHNGGRVRMAGLIQALRPAVVLAATARTPEPCDARAVGLPQAGRSRLAAVLGTGPRLGRGLLGGAAVEEVRRHAASLQALVVSHSYLAAELPELDVPLVVDFQNLEVLRQADAKGPLAWYETLKAGSWEPRVARRAAVCVCVDERDAAVVRGWGAQQVVVVPNVVEVPISPASPRDGYVLLVGDWRYGPNADGLRWFHEQVAPHVQSRVVVVGRGSESVPGGIGFVADLGPLYDAAAVVVSPVGRGAGTQLKVAEALARGRLVVTRPYGARSVPPGAAVGTEVAAAPQDFARAVERTVRELDQRAVRERSLRSVAIPRSWDEAAAPLLRVLPGVGRG